MTERKVILITGCSSGFGFLTAARLAALGHQVYATMRDLRKKEFLEIEAASRGGAKNLVILPLDVTKPDTIKATVKDIVAHEGFIDVVVNNAGFGIGGFFEDLSDADWRQQYDVNFFGALNVTREMLPIMRPRRKGLIINITSMAAFSGTPAFSAYCSSKFALEGFSECLYMELHPQGIDVALVEPGSYRTKIFESNARFAARFFDPQSPYFSWSQKLKNLVDEHARVNRNNPEDVAEVIENIINSSRPAFRNIVGLRCKLRYWLVKHLPFKFYAWLVDLALSPNA
ncbi:MAG: SDR family oxidoreductase [Candidatus Omnitrophica bacterium]|nr:SDR family oxidoreductase [Candidatus Omnitrophota bacterium]